MFHKRTKHFDVDFHYVRERVALKALNVKHIPASLQLTDIFTRSLAQEPFFKLRSKLGVSLPPSPSLRGYINAPRTEHSAQVSSDSGSSCRPVIQDIKHISQSSQQLIQLDSDHVKSILNNQQRKCIPRTSATVHMTAHGIPTNNIYGCLGSCAEVS